MPSKRKNLIRKKVVHAPMALMKPVDYPNPVPFSRGIRVDLGKWTFLFISGTASVDKNGKTVYSGDFLAQAKHTFGNLTALLQSEGATWYDVVKTTCYLKSMKNYEIFNKFRRQFYKNQKLTILPASSCVEANLCRTDLLLEVEAIAILKNKKKHGKT